MGGVDSVLPNSPLGIPRYYISSCDHGIRMISIVGVVSLHLPSNEEKDNTEGYNLNVKNRKSVTPRGSSFWGLWR